MFNFSQEAHSTYANCLVFKGTNSAPWQSSCIRRDTKDIRDLKRLWNLLSIRQSDVISFICRGVLDRNWGVLTPNSSRKLHPSAIWNTRQTSYVHALCLNYPNRPGGETATSRVEMVEFSGPMEEEKVVYSMTCPLSSTRKEGFAPMLPLMNCSFLDLCDSRTTYLYHAPCLLGPGSDNYTTAYDTLLHCYPQTPCFFFPRDYSPFLSFSFSLQLCYYSSSEWKPLILVCFIGASSSVEALRDS